MKAKLFKAIEIFFESLYFLIITYTLSSMAISFNFDLFGLLCRVANIFAITQYYKSTPAAPSGPMCCWQPICSFSPPLHGM